MEESLLTGPWSDVWHVNQRAGVLDEGGVMHRHTCAEALRISSLVELGVRHRDGGFVLTYKGQNTYFRKAVIAGQCTLQLFVSFFFSPICLMPSLSSISSCTLGMSMCNRGPWGGPFTGVSKLRLFLLIQTYETSTHTRTHSQAQNIDWWIEVWFTLNDIPDWFCEIQ